MCNGKVGADMRAKAMLLCALMLTFSLSGCFGNDDEPVIVDDDDSLPDGVFVTGADGQRVNETPLNLEFVFSDVGEDGPEPSIGITSSGCMFFVAMAKVMRSCDHGGSWEDVADYASAPTTSDPYLWVDPVTDRVFNVQMVGLATTWIAFSDDDGESW